MSFARTHRAPAGDAVVVAVRFAATWFAWLGPGLDGPAAGQRPRAKSSCRCACAGWRRRHLLVQLILCQAHCGVVALHNHPASRPGVGAGQLRVNHPLRPRPGSPPTPAGPCRLQQIENFELFRHMLSVEEEDEAALRHSQAIIARLRNRQLYKYVTDALLPQASRQLLRRVTPRQAGLRAGPLADAFVLGMCGRAAQRACCALSGVGDGCGDGCSNVAHAARASHLVRTCWKKPCYMRRVHMCRVAHGPALHFYLVCGAPPAGARGPLVPATQQIPSPTRTLIRTPTRTPRPSANPIFIPISTPNPSPHPHPPTPPPTCVPRRTWFRATTGGRPLRRTLSTATGGALCSCGPRMSSCRWVP